MTIEEKRNKEASEAWKRMGYANNEQSEAFKLGFMMGSDWQRNRIWHDADKEQPKGYREVVAIKLSNKSGDVITRCASVYEGRIWAYVDDLLPNSNITNIK